MLPSRPSPRCSCKAGGERGRQKGNPPPRACPSPPTHPAPPPARPPPSRGHRWGDSWCGRELRWLPPPPGRRERGTLDAEGGPLLPGPALRGVYGGSARLSKREVGTHPDFGRDRPILSGQDRKPLPIHLGRRRVCLGVGGGSLDVWRGGGLRGGCPSAAKWRRLGAGPRAGGGEQGATGCHTQRVECP